MDYQRDKKGFITTRLKYKIEYKYFSAWVIRMATPSSEKLFCGFIYTNNWLNASSKDFSRAWTNFSLIALFYDICCIWAGKVARDSYTIQWNFWRQFISEEVRRPLTRFRDPNLITYSIRVARSVISLGVCMHAIFLMVFWKAILIFGFYFLSGICIPS